MPEARREAEAAGHRRRAPRPRGARRAAEHLRPLPFEEIFIPRQRRSEGEKSFSLLSLGDCGRISRPRRGRSRCAPAPRGGARPALHGGARPARGLELRSARRAPRSSLRTGHGSSSSPRTGRKSQILRPVARDGRRDVPFPARRRGRNPFWSADGRMVGFMGQTTGLAVVPATGGAVDTSPPSGPAGAAARPPRTGRSSIRRHSSARSTA